eukprot:CAMPEP_0201568406 /NCGR_PEP_ID=MMETSP0190_2-20130828/9466_1 /ASSEMBLY_ACC=CAM_ASM_000263 /TAXON_ID=37353 /ORGANISM="Rosalina sp." /LENGTH=366 /DNA_ID=CAMNT_0047989485 /DNA_START=35 /DNA_END=1135 /DNA_ORIENTATION=-
MSTMSTTFHFVLLVLFLSFLNIHHLNAQPLDSTSLSASGSSSSEEFSSTQATIDVADEETDTGDDEEDNETDSSLSASSEGDEDTDPTVDGEDTANTNSESPSDDGDISDSVDDSTDGDGSDTETDDSDDTDNGDDETDEDDETNGDEETVVITSVDGTQCSGDADTDPCGCLNTQGCEARADCLSDSGCISTQDPSENRLVASGAANSSEAASSDEMWAIIGGSTGGLLALGAILGGLYIYKKRKNQNEDTSAAVSKSISLQMSEDPEKGIAMAAPMSPDGNRASPMTGRGRPVPPAPMMVNPMHKGLQEEEMKQDDEETEMDGVSRETGDRRSTATDIVLPQATDSRHTSITSRQAEEEKAAEM